MKILTILLLTLSLNAFAHEEGHGPKLTDSGKFGGVLASVILEGDTTKGDKAVRHYKAELVRSEDNDIILYFYDEKMNLIPMSKFSKDARGSIETQKNKKFVLQDFKLTAKGNHFEGKAPQPHRRPFNLDIRFEEGSKKLFVAFENLD